MPSKKQVKNAARGRQRLERDRVGDLCVDIPDETGEHTVRISFRRTWYSPPFKDDGEVDFERAAEELSSELTGSVLVVRRYLENGDMGYATEIPVDSEEVLEHILNAMRAVYVESLQHDNAVRLAGLKTCKTAISRSEQTAQLEDEQRQDRERRLLRRRGRQLLGRAWFRRNDRRTEADRRGGLERRTV